MTLLRKLFGTTTFRLALIFMLLFGTAAMLAIGYIYWNTKAILTRQLNQTIEAELQGIAEHYYNGGVPRVITAIRLRSRKPGTSIYFIADNNGKYIAGNIQSVPQDLWNQDGIFEFVYARDYPGGDETLDFEDRLAFASVFKFPDGHRVIIGKDIEERRIFEEVIGSAIFWVLGGMILVGLGGGWLISRRLLARIEAVTASSRSIMAGNLSERLPVHGSADEFDRLAISLNTMLERIEELMKGMKEVSDNIAHDLKTPLTRLRNRVEAVLLSDDEKKYRQTLEATIEDADGLIKTFQSLLSIARMEAGTAPTSFEKINISQILIDVGEFYAPVVEETKGTLKLDIQPDLFMNADRQLLGQMLTNLIDNAVKYATPDDSAHASLALTLQAMLHNGKIRILLTDNGPGIPEDEREHVLKRFVRLEKSRSQPGSGLGLSLVHAIVQLHKGSLNLQDNQPGLKVIIDFPATRHIDVSS